jgi:hypothetical protein
MIVAVDPLFLDIRGACRERRVLLTSQQEQ